MGKSKGNKGGGKGSASSGAASTAKKCTCDHPYNCACGNRPPRPSKGHKWDAETQQWGGKGHKQKGASGQTASLAQAAKTTSVGKTQIAQWQRLPSTLLKEYCQREKRRPYKFKNISKKSEEFLYRIILPDAKNPDKDLFFVPSQGVPNEEQALEEACILALLHQTPKLPHERKLPEPYKTTWLHAIQAIKTKDNDTKKTDNTKQSAAAKDDRKKPATTTTNDNKSSNSAQASTSLTSGQKFTSHADKQRHYDEKKRARAKRIRHHENIRLANKNHPVFLAAHLRQQIQALLRGEDGDGLELNLDTPEEDDDDDDITQLGDGPTYVLDRLRTEGFTQRQVLTALQQQPNTNNIPEEKWDALYEDCLQWLCIHLDEDQLPEGFDPRGGTLDVIVATSTNTASTTSATATSGNSQNNNPQATKLAKQYGLSLVEAQHVVELASKSDGNVDHETTLWKALQTAAGTSLEPSTKADTSEENVEALNEEIEALEAIYASEFKATKQDDNKTTILTVQMTDHADMTLQVVVEQGLYPMVYPQRVLLQSNSSSSWPKPNVGTAVHVELIQYLANSIELGSPMLFELYGQAQELLHSASAGELPAVSLVPGGAAATNSNTKAAAKPKSQTTASNSEQQQASKTQPVVRPRRQRPRERSVFWAKHPSQTTPAVAFPNITRDMERARKSLPAFSARKEFLAAMAKADKNGRVMLVTGDTGCGKTTQIPQFILEEAPREEKIVVAQPRRLAATGVAGRVANERGEDQPGKNSVGYVVRGDSALGANSRLVFCTTGVLLRQLQCEGALNNITTIVVDEVHERHLDSDVLLGFLKLRLKDYPKLRVVLMSATLDADKFASYWGTNTPRIHIPGRTFPVTDFMLEDVLQLTGYIPPKNKKKKKWQGNQQRPRKSTPWNDSEKSDDEGEEEEASPKATNAGGRGPQHSIPLEELVKRVDETDLDYDLLARLICHLVRTRGPEDDGSILAFLSGAPEINSAMEVVKKVGQNLPIQLLPLHGGLQPKDQKVVFQPPRNGLTKVILSTNVAETSITIPDCTIVIDSCREKESSYDPTNRMPLLLEQFASKASLKQRRGRAGRVREGTCYKLISKNTYAKLKEHGDPEIRRCALDQTLLSLLFLGFGSDFMGKLMDPPSKQSVDSALFSLKKLGAVTADRPGDSVLTPLGMHLAGIPAPPSVGKLLVMGAVLGCRKAAIAMAAGMSVGRSPFLRVDPPQSGRGGEEDERTAVENMKKQRILDERKALFSKVGNSDHNLLVAVYLQWEDTAPGGGGRKRLCDSLGLGFNSMRDMMQLVNQYDSSLRAAGYMPSKDADRNMRSWTVIRACAVAALAPSQLVRLQRSTTKYVETVEGAMEKDGEAKELKFFIRGSIEEQQQEDSLASTTTTTTTTKKLDERVFVHPSSFNFKVGNYYCPWLVYHTMVRTSKPFLRDVTECSAYSLLLFAGDLEVRANEGTVVVDGWVKLEAKARIGSLVGGLRQRLDNLLAKKIDDPSFDLAGSNEMKLIVKLLVSDGHG